MKKITITLSDEAEKVFNDIMYDLPHNEDGTGVCTQSDAINHSLINYQEFLNFFYDTDDDYLDNKNK